MLRIIDDATIGKLKTGRDTIFGKYMLTVFMSDNDSFRHSRNETVNESRLRKKS